MKANIDLSKLILLAVALALVGALITDIVLTGGHNTQDILAALVSGLAGVE